MSKPNGLVLDANILLTAVLGQRVRGILEKYEDSARFYSPDVCFQDAQRYIPEICERRDLDAGLALAVLNKIGEIVQQVDQSLYEEYRSTRRGGLAPNSVDARSEFADLDRGPGFLRQRGRHMDDRPC
jgi:hypothetical protein